MHEYSTYDGNLVPLQSAAFSCPAWRAGDPSLPIPEELEKAASPKLEDETYSGPKQAPSDRMLWIGSFTHDKEPQDNQ